MLRKLFLLAVLAATGSSFSQIGVGTTTPQAALDVTSGTNGMLVPRVALTSKTVSTPVVNPQGGGLVNGTLVFNTATAGTAPNNVVPGFYYWNGSAWIEIASGPSNSWGLTGNSGTSAATNYIGTSDAQDLRFRTSGSNRLNINDGNGQIGTFTQGSAGAPAYSFYNDNNTGLFSPTTDVLALSTNGSERARIQANGNMAIGTTAADNSAIIDASATNKGVSFPNVALTSETDAATIPSPKAGLMVYNTTGTLPCGKGLYFNNGTPAAPIWTCFTKTKREFHAYNTSQRAAVSSTTLTLQPGCTISLTIPTGQIADVTINAILGGLNVSSTTGAYSVIDVVIYVDNTFLPQGGWNRVTLANPNNTNAFGATSLTSITTLGPGNHTIQLFSSRSYGTSAVNIGGNCSIDTNCGEIHASVTYR